MQLWIRNEIVIVDRLGEATKILDVKVFFQFSYFSGFSS